MPWIKRQAKEHSCKRPNINPLWRKPPQAGDIWQCEECEEKWRVCVNNGLNSGYEPFFWMYLE